MARLIGTAGHVDHGKTTLIRALTGIDADRLPEERARGMTIDIGFAYADLPGIGRVSIVDVPGHERFLTNMLVGALGIDVALLVVAADESVMPQTREHFQILELLPVQKMVVALTRCDLANRETRDIARAEIESLLAKTRFADAPLLEVSATTGEGLEALRAALAQALEAPSESGAGPWYLPIDRVFTVKGQGVVVTGTLARGQVQDGERAVLMPAGRVVRIRSVQSHGEAAPSSEKGRRTALNLGGVKLEDVERGMAVGAPGALFSTRVLDCRIRWLVAPKHGLRVRVSVGADEAMGKAFLNDGDPELVQLRLERPIACALGQPLIVRRYSPAELLGGGHVVVPQAKIRRKSEQLVTVEGTGSDEEAILTLLAGNEQGMPTDDIARHLGQTAQSLGEVLESLLKAKKLFGFSGLWYDKAAFVAAAGRFLKALGELHAEQPTQALASRDKVAGRAGLKWTGKPFDRILAALTQSGKLHLSGTGVRLPSFQIALSAKQRAFLDRVVGTLDAAGANPPSSQDLANLVHAPVQAVDEILRLGVEAGAVVRVAEGIYYSPSQLEVLQAQARKLGAKGPFTAAEFRDAVGTSRKYAIPLLEYFDARRVTVRVGDRRMVQSG